MKRLAIALAGLALAAVSAAAAAQWKPSRPVTIIVPWAAGGSTDQVTRITAGELEKVLGQKVVIVNQPGAAGSIGTKNALEAAKDGYTWAAGAAQDLGVYRTLGMLDTNLGDWHLFLQRCQRAGGQRERGDAVQGHEGAARRDEGEARRDHRRDRRRHLRRPQRDGSDLQGDRREVPPRHLRRRQPRGRRHRRRRDAGHHPARGRAGRDDPRQAHPAARLGERQAGGHRGLRHDRADHEVDPELQGGHQLLRHLRSQGRSAGGRRDPREGLGRHHRQQRGAPQVRHAAAARCSRRSAATRRRRPRSPPCRPMRG